MLSIGRLIIRESRTAGIFIPFDTKNIETGIYNIMEIMGELTVKYVGKPAMESNKLNALSLEQLLKNPSVALTKTELKLVNFCK